MSDGTDPSARPFFLATENLRGITLMVVARLVFAGSDTFTKLASEGLPASEVVVLRNAISLPIVFVMAWRLGGVRPLGALGAPRVCLPNSVEGAGTAPLVRAPPSTRL